MAVSKEDQILWQHFHDLADRSYQRGIAMFSNFVERYQLEEAKRAANSAGVYFESFGGYPDAVRQMVCFSPKKDFVPNSDNIPYPLTCVQIAPANRRFCDELSHRDYLGTVMNLGLERDQIGDILVKKEGHSNTEYTVGYLFVVKNKAQLLTDITRIRHTTVHTEIFDGSELTLQQEFRVYEGSVSSMRLDAVLAVAIRQPRGKCVQLIKDKAVSLNGRPCTENAKQVNHTDIVSVRGYGKYMVESTLSQTRKGRCHITVKQYI